MTHEHETAPSELVTDAMPLLMAAKLLYQNSVGCLQKHHGHDVAMSGLPGWLEDCRIAIEQAGFLTDGEGLSRAAVDIFKEATATLELVTTQRDVALQRVAALEAQQAMPDAEPAFYAIHAISGSHIGLWPKKVDAEQVALEYEGCTITPLFVAPPKPVAEAVKVRDLVWGKTSYGTPEVITVVGVYRVFTAWNGGWSVSIKNDSLCDTDGRSNFATVELAKAAAQADFERRIRSAIKEGE